MPEKMLSVNQVCRRLGRISLATFNRLEPRLIAKGVLKTKIGRRHMYDERSLDKLIRRLFDDERAREEGL